MSQEFFELMICPWQQIHNAKLSISGKSEHATGRTPNLMCYPVMLITGNKFINLYSISVSCYSRSSISMLICQSGGQPWVFFLLTAENIWLMQSLTSFSGLDLWTLPMKTGVCSFGCIGTPGFYRYGARQEGQIWGSWRDGRNFLRTITDSINIKENLFKMQNANNILNNVIK